MVLLLVAVSLLVLTGGCGYIISEYILPPVWGPDPWGPIEYGLLVLSVGVGIFVLVFFATFTP